LQIHVTDTTYKLLDRKLYEFHERSASATDGLTLTNTYFVLNKKDRAGNLQSRPFQIILEQMKRQEKYEAKLKQANSLTGGQTEDSLRSKDNGSATHSTSIQTKDVTAASTKSTGSEKVNNDVDATSNLVYDALTKSKMTNGQSIKKAEMSPEFQIVDKSLHGQLRSRACTLI
jgi:hypothetical protein